MTKARCVSVYLKPEFIELLDEKKRCYSRSSFIEVLLMGKYGSEMLIK